MTVGDEWLKVFDKLVGLLEGLTDPTGAKLFSAVLKGWKEAYSGNKVAAVLPLSIPVTPTTTLESEHIFKYQLLIITENADTVMGLRDAVWLAGKVHEKIIQDRTLGNLVYNTEVSSWELEARVMKGYIRHRLALTVEAYKQM